MSASLSDHFTKTFNGQNPNVAHVTSTRATGGTTLTVDDLSGWPTDTKVHFQTYKVNSSNVKIQGSQTDWEAIVSGSTLTSLTRLAGATDGGSAVGDSVEMMPTASWANDLAVGLLTEHNQNGTHNSSLVAMLAGTQTLTGNKTFSGTTVFTGTTTLPSATVATSNIIDDAVNGAKMINGVVLSRVGGNSTNWSTNGTTSYDTSTTDVKTVMGSTATTGLTTTVSFGMTFTAIPLIIVSPHGNAGVYSAFYITSESTTGFAFVAQTSANLPSFTWVAYGV